MKDQEDKSILENLREAIRMKDIEMLTELLRNGVGVNLRDEDGESLLHYAIEEEGDETVIKSLLNYRLREAIRLKNIELLTKLLKNGAYANLQDEDGESLLHYAIEEIGDETVIKTLLNCGADVNLVNHDDDTALHYAVWSCKLEIVKEILMNNVELEAQNCDGLTALKLALNCENDEIANELFCAGACYDTTSFISIRRRDETLIDTLLNESTNKKDESEVRRMKDERLTPYLSLHEFLIMPLRCSKVLLAHSLIKDNVLLNYPSYKRLITAKIHYCALRMDLIHQFNQVFTKLAFRINESGIVFYIIEHLSNLDLTNCIKASGYSSLNT